MDGIQYQQKRRCKNSANISGVLSENTCDSLENDENKERNTIFEEESNWDFFNDDNSKGQTATKKKKKDDADAYTIQGNSTSGENGNDYQTDVLAHIHGACPHGAYTSTGWMGKPVSCAQASTERMWWN
mmetsp:Transcript_64432/g.75587  ORF Transcript_64432/g.75587 Transcript_64432/m.75587 type:complete len:129 (+) Transcript_64432:397-783(+)|eukprot:CAMPEP_0194399446 /NCGR_PEP_ID=MMETSP0174-20130528/126666_1 /TAXON_ID=216777 /ORGANISM="Proboscia alata, Strain PI-D3" /LENGTH=128 /DNA_ID=CAMNT_0039195859 /DNA_START=1067 /DNA_END=1453 /DNA_ORIENTATION=-